MHIKRFLLGVVLAGSLSTNAQQQAPESSKQKESIHKSFNLINQFEGGALSRYVNTHITEFFPNIILQKSAQPLVLEKELNPAVGSLKVRFQEKEMPLSEYVHAAPVDGMLVIHHGKIVFETYPRMHPDQRHLYMSVSKPFVSTLVAILEDRGLVDVQKPIEYYIPELKGSDWEGVLIINILDMSTGLCWEFEKGMDTFSDMNSCFIQFDGSVGWSPTNETTPDHPYEALKTMRRYKEQGISNDYSSINTFVLSWLIEKITGMRYSDFLVQEIWQPMGAEHDGLMLTPKRNIQAVYGGMSSTLRDLGRFGLLFTPSSSRDIISEDYLEKIQTGGRPELFEVTTSIPFIFPIDGETPAFCTYQWDLTMPDGDFYKSGFLGQGLYISPDRDLVIAYFGTYEKDGTSHDLRSICRQLAKLLTSKSKSIEHR